ncbi:MSHA biogenesis protein MshG [Thalassolituus maritimus]|uniref:MSHA biogenesis protein MshG n=1 Tax=Thalassolituus maritimus TaxID=484498 RepID=A0A1N7NSW3_9GAMM|nr:type II secretion system F family protein [Thalassolituus maritimus]SIT01407.1 MSHA biogenesis protein MshG [Thalassolituus maritimus]
MAIFLYRGRDNSGAAVEGSLQAGSREVAVSQLMQRGITPLKIQQQKALPTKDGKTVQRSRKIKSEELVLFTRQLYALTKAGVPIIRALTGLAESANNDQLRTVLQDISEQLVGGSDLASAFRRHPKLFSPIYVSMIHIGESTGNLDDALLRLVGHLEMERETKKRIKSALRYPIMVVSAITIAMVVVTMFVIPSFSSVFNKLGADLPFATLILISVSEFMQNWWHLLLAGLVVGGVAFRQFISTDEGAVWWDRTKLNIPLIGSIFERIALARFSRSFSMMLTAGVPILNSLSIVAASVGNRFIGNAVSDMGDGVQRGEGLTNTAQRTGLFTPLVLQMMSVGEETGSVDRLLDEVADFYEEEVDYELKQLSDAIEPILLVFLGALVLLLALGVFLPVWELSGAVSR